MGVGETAALTAALCWASASLLYGRTRLTAVGLNFGKNLLASGLLLLQLLVVAQWSDGALLTADLKTWGWLGLSGLFGIVMGDTLYFRSLQILGPRRALIVSTTAPVFATALGFLFLSEAITGFILTGIALTVGGIMVVVADRASVAESPGLFPGSTKAGIAAGLAGAICQALGGLFSRIGMEHVGSIEGAFIRLVVSALTMIVVVAWQRRLNTTVRQLADRRLLRTFVPAVLMGTWLGIWLSQVAYKHAPVSIVTTLLCTTPIFAVPLVRLFDRHRISRRAIWGTVVAVMGIVLVVQG